MHAIWHGDGILLNLSDILGVLEKLPTWNTGSDLPSKTAAPGDRPSEAVAAPQVTPASGASHDLTQAPEAAEAPDAADILALMAEVGEQTVVGQRDDAAPEITIQPS